MKSILRDFTKKENLQGGILARNYLVKQNKARRNIKGKEAPCALLNVGARGSKWQSLFWMYLFLLH
jgi:hypothetical protein